jgi:hypothetical protein
LDGEPLVVPVLLGAQDVDVGVDPGLGHVADLDPGAVDGSDRPGAARASGSSAGKGGMLGGWDTGRRRTGQEAIAGGGQ